ncbi:hypothetical protein BFP72_12580 [Reichenbachiella sp. 5M10]|nr:hypothetical protein BFP72_12580 [Reichenbachiella sp. 5M10]
MCVLLGMFMSLMFGMSMMIRADFFVSAIHRLPNDAVMLTFDDGPHPANTPLVLDVLQEKGVKAMFFLIGKNIQAYPEITQRIIDEGHAIGGHTYAHNHGFGFKLGKNLSRDIMKAQRYLSDLTGEEELYFRPPFGVTNPSIAQVINENKLKTVGWSVRTYDTAVALNDDRVKQLVGRIDNGAIVLLHERVDATCEALPLLIDGVREKGMKFGLLPKNKKE